MCVHHFSKITFECHGGLFHYIYKQPIFLNSVLLVKLLIKGSYDAIKFSFVFGVLQAV